MDEKTAAQKIATQHRLIGFLFGGLGDAIAAREQDRSRDRAASLRRALDSHFVLEEEHYFPRLRDERPNLGADVERLIGEHVDMRSKTEQVDVGIGRADWGEAVRDFDALRSLFERHEAFERKVVAS